MIRFRKGGSLRIGRRDSPEPPFNAATVVEPYSFPRTVPLAFDYIRLIATSVARAEVQISSADTIERHVGSGPVLIDSTGAAELVYRRGESLHQAFAARGLTTIQLISADGWVPQIETSAGRVVVCTWPADPDLLASIARDLAAQKLTWGVAIPIAFPVTTDLDLLEEFANIAAENAAAFLLGVRCDLDPSARRAIAVMAPTDDETYSTLFDEGEEAIAIATERHIAFLARERQLDDLIIPDTDTRTNWSAASRIASAGYRLLQMAEDVELAWEFVRSARLVAMLDKPLQRIATAANLGIIEALPLQISEALEQWLEAGDADLFAQIDDRWRMRRDYRV